MHFKTIEYNDLQRLVPIYNWYITQTTATFHTEEITPVELAEIIPVNHPRYPALMVLEGSEVVGYCYLNSYKNRQAYAHTAEVAIYLAPAFCGKGIGKLVLEHIEDVAKNIQVTMLLSVISGENTSSIKLFERANYEKCAHMKRVGEKFGKLLDVVILQKEI